MSALRTTAFHFEPDQEIDEIDRRENGHGEQKSDQQLFCRTGIFKCVAFDRCVRPQMPPHIGREPETIKPDCNKLKQRATHDEPTKDGPVGVKCDLG